MKLYNNAFLISLWVFSITRSCPITTVIGLSIWCYRNEGRKKVKLENGRIFLEEYFPSVLQFLSTSGHDIGVPILRMRTCHLSTKKKYTYVVTIFYTSITKFKYSSYILFNIKSNDHNIYSWGVCVFLSLVEFKLLLYYIYYPSNKITIQKNLTYSDGFSWYLTGQNKIIITTITWIVQVSAN
jgi:hypothetical protein